MTRTDEVRNADTAACLELLDAARTIDGGWHIKDLSNGRCIDVMKMIYNYRIVISARHHAWAEHGWCYFGHGADAQGAPRSTATALLAALLAAAAWDGRGHPPGHDKQAF